MLSVYQKSLHADGGTRNTPRPGSVQNKYGLVSRTVALGDRGRWYGPRWFHSRREPAASSGQPPKLACPLHGAESLYEAIAMIGSAPRWPAARHSSLRPIMPSCPRQPIQTKSTRRRSGAGYAGGVDVGHCPNSVERVEFPWGYPHEHVKLAHLSFRPRPPGAAAGIIERRRRPSIARRPRPGRSPDPPHQSPYRQPCIRPPSCALGECQGSCRLNSVMIPPIEDAAVLAA